MSELWDCPVCYNTFDERKFVPKLITTCGHTFCIICLAKIIGKTCPLDRQPLPPHKKSCKEYPTNILILQALDKILSSNRCSRHKKLKDMVCLTDSCTICETCSKGQSHHGHKIKSLEIVKKEAESKTKRLKLLINEFENAKRNLRHFVFEEKQKITKSVQEFCNQFRHFLPDQKKMIFQEIDDVFYCEGMITNDQVKSYKLIIKELDIQLSDLKYNSINKRFLDTLKKNPPTLRGINQEIERLKRVFKILQHKIQNQLERLSQPFLSVLINTDEILTPQKGINKSENDQTLHLLKYKIHKLLDINIENNQLTLSPAPLTKNASTSNIIPRFENLKIDTVILDCNKNYLTKESLEMMHFLFMRVMQPSILELDLNGCTEDKLEILKANTFWCSQKYQKISMHFHNSEVNHDIFIKIFGDSLTEMTKLNHLYVNMGHTNLEDETIQALCYILQPRLRNLSCLRLEFYETKLTDKGALELMTRLNGRVNNLRELNLNFCQTKISDQCINAFSENLLEKMTNLEEFGLLLDETQITDQSLFALHSGFLVTKNIKRIHLSLNSTKITGEGFYQLSLSLKALNKIQSLYLHLSNIKVTNQDLNKFFEILKQMRNLEIFELNLIKTEVTTISLTNFKESVLPFIHKIKQLNLHLEETWTWLRGK